MNIELLASISSSAYTVATAPFQFAAGTLAAVGEAAVTRARVHRPPNMLRAQTSEHHDADPDDTPVLLVPGYLSHHASWDTLLHRLHLSGFRNVFCLHYSPFKMDIPAIASMLAAEVRQALQHSGASGVHLVGYSLGGLAVRYAVQQLGLDDKVLGAVTIATPHRGALLAHLGIGPAVRQLRSNSPLLAALPDINAEQEVRWSLIGSQFDAVVSLFSATAGRHVSSCCVSGCGHLRIIKSPHMADIVVGHLKSTSRGDTHAEAVPLAQGRQAYAAAS
ncbi:alpha/beta fold hydrolase [Streptomyces sp. NPDC050315]|uniref:esterase/lipase family protein n=1 Tax=Streptomyces sp. NPDC050315 TaxID=3155039 RepID=UPI00344190B6